MGAMGKNLTHEEICMRLDGAPVGVYLVHIHYVCEHDSVHFLPFVGSDYKMSINNKKKNYIKKSENVSSVMK